MSMDRLQQNDDSFLIDGYDWVRRFNDEMEAIGPNDNWNLMVSMFLGEFSLEVLRVTSSGPLSQEGG